MQRDIYAESKGFSRRGRKGRRAHAARGTSFTLRSASSTPRRSSIGVAPRFHTLADIKNFVADLVFSDETLVADVTINRPGETMRKMLPDDVKLSAFAEILRNPALLDLALSPKIAGVVKEGFASGRKTPWPRIWYNIHST